MQIPHGPKELKCPLWQKSMAQVCHTCPMWVQLRGVDPQTGVQINDEWNCSLGHLPRLLIEGAQMSRHTCASVDKLASEVAKANRTVISLASPHDQQLLLNGGGTDDQR